MIVDMSNGFGTLVYVQDYLQCPILQIKARVGVDLLNTF